MLREDLDRFSLFHGLSEAQMHLLEPLLEYCAFPAGQVVFEQGAAADSLYVLLRGTVDVRYKPYDGPELTVARIQPGGVFGWSAALRRDAYTSAAVTCEAVEAYRVNGAKLRCLCEHNPETGMVLLERLASIIAERLSSTHDQIMAILQNSLDRCDNPERCKK